MTDKYDGYDRLSQSIKHKKRLLNDIDSKQSLTFNGYLKHIKTVGYDEFDKHFKREYRKHQDEINEWYKKNPGFGKAKKRKSNGK